MGQLADSRREIERGQPQMLGLPEKLVKTLTPGATLREYRQNRCRSWLRHGSVGVRRLML
jgi:hypothetical protein